MITVWKCALLDGAADIFGKIAQSRNKMDSTVDELQRQIGNQSFLIEILTIPGHSIIRIFETITRRVLCDQTRFIRYLSCPEYLNVTTRRGGRVKSSPVAGFRPRRSLLPFT
jgi:hypothetical protein